MRLPLFAILAALPFPALAEPAAQLARDYCAAVTRFDEAAAVALMAPALQAAILRARTVDDAFVKAHPDEKPPLGDGLRLAAFPDAPESCTPGTVTDIDAILRYQPAGSEEGAWSDRLILVPDGQGGVLIGDIDFGMKDEDTLSLWLDTIATGE